MTMFHSIDNAIGTMGAPARAIVKHFANRLLELQAAVVMIAIGLHLMIWPGAIATSSLHHMLDALSGATITLLFFAFGAVRISALIANGYWPFYGPLMRAAGATMGAMLFGQMAAALISASSGNPSFGIPVYLTMVSFELISVYRALQGMQDGQRKTRH